MAAIVINSPWLYVRGWRAETTSFPSDIHSLHILPTATRTIILHTINHFGTNRCRRIRIATGDTFLRKELILLQLNLLTGERAVHHTLVHFVDSVKLPVQTEHEAHWKPFSWILLVLFTFPLARKWIRRLFHWFPQMIAAQNACQWPWGSIPLKA